MRATCPSALELELYMLLGTRRGVGLLVLITVGSAAVAAPVSGQGSWETTLQPRDFNGDQVVDAYFDTDLDITWLADASPMPFSYWHAANQWATGLSVGEIADWRLPKVAPINGTNFQFDWRCDGTSDLGAADSSGWGLASELGHMYYATLGNKGQCAPGTKYEEQPGWGLKNTAMFDGLEADGYWTGTVTGVLDTMRWTFGMSNGIQYPYRIEQLPAYAWAVHDGDVFPALVPEPNSSLLALIALAGLGFVGQSRVDCRTCRPMSGL